MIPERKTDGESGEKANRMRGLEEAGDARPKIHRAGPVTVLAAYAIAFVFTFFGTSLIYYGSFTARPPSLFLAAWPSLSVIPAYLLLRWRGWFGLWQLVGVNAALSIMMCSVMQWQKNGFGAPPFSFLAINAVAVATIFWAVIRFREGQGSSHCGYSQPTPKTARVAAAFLLLPLPIGICFAILFGSVRIGMVAQVAASGLTLALGLPIYLFFRRMGWLTLWQSVLAGACLGLIAGLILHLFLNPGASVQLINIVAFPGIGALVAGIFWLSAIKGTRGKPSISKG